MEYASTAIWLIRLGVALTMVVFGLHELAKPGQWTHYIPQFMKASSPLAPETSMRLHALGNIVFGVFLVSGLFPLVAVWVAIIWWASILPFAFMVKWDIGMRDLTIIIGLVALLLLLMK